MRKRPSFLLVPALAAMAFIGSPVPSHAQAPGVSAPPGLKMSPAQQARAKTLQQQFVQKVQAIQANKSLTPTQKTTQEQALAKAHDTEMLAVLTLSQRAQVTAQRQAALSQSQGFMKQHGSEIKAGSALAAKLSKSLTASQKAQIGTIRSQLQAQGSSLQSNTTLSQQAKLQQWQAANQQAQAKITAILTPTQKADYMKMMQMQKQLMKEAGSGQQPH